MLVDEGGEEGLEGGFRTSLRREESFSLVVSATDGFGVGGDSLAWWSGEGVGAEGVSSA